MTQEEKQLLLKDLCARLPYGVKVENGGVGKTVESITIKPDYIEIVIKGIYAYCHFIYKNTEEWDKDNDLSRCKPYLRPMSSMTEEEKNKYLNTFKKSIIGTDEEDGRVWTVDSIDWLNAHHFDYRGLIEKGLAIEAPEGMYNKKNNNYNDNYVPNNSQITVGTKIRLKTNKDIILSIISNDCHDDEFECSNGSVLSLKQIEKYYDIII